MSRINTQKNNTEVYIDSLQRMKDTLIQYRSICIQLHRRIPYNITKLDKILEFEIQRILDIEKEINKEMIDANERLRLLKYKHVDTIQNKPC